MREFTNEMTDLMIMFRYGRLTCHRQPKAQLSFRLIGDLFDCDAKTAA